MKAEALKWENKRLEEAKSRLEAQVRDLQRRLAQREEALAEARSPRMQKRPAPGEEASAEGKSPRRHEQVHRGQHSSPKVLALALLLAQFQSIKGPVQEFSLFHCCIVGSISLVLQIMICCLCESLGAQPGRLGVC